MTMPAISVVIPALNEADCLPRLLDALAGEDGPTEIIIVDGGSTDGTVALAAARGHLVLPGATGRGQQLALGARRARGGILLFLHADTTFPAGGLARIVRELEVSPHAVGGNFRVIFDGQDGIQPLAHPVLCLDKAARYLLWRLRGVRAA